MPNDDRHIEQIKICYRRKVLSAMRKYIVWFAGVTFICTMASCTCHSPKNINEPETKTSDFLNNAASEVTDDSVVTTEN